MAAVGNDAAAWATLPVPDAHTPLAQWLAWLEAGRGDHIDLGLERAREVAAAMGLTRPAPVVLTVAGTNGKGSSVALLERTCRAAGYRVGAYTSPHLVRYNERVRVDGVDVDDATLAAAFARVESARRDVPLTYFEFGTLAAFAVFEAAGLDVAILEVGLGGRLDAVNIVDADVALIAAIGLDHEAWLGDTRERIAVEKAGIMRRGRPVVCSDHELPVTMLECAQASGAIAHRLGVEYCFEDEGERWTWWAGERVLEDLPRPALDGTHQLRNAAGVIAALILLEPLLPVTRAHIEEGLATVRLRGRFHRVAGAVEYVMDVAHNPQAARIFVDTLAPMPPARRTHALVGMLRTKNHPGFLAPLTDVVDSWTFASLPSPNGARAEDLARALAEVAPRARAECHADVASAHASLRARAEPGDRVLVLGSFLTVGALLDAIADAP